MFCNGLMSEAHAKYRLFVGIQHSSNRGSIPASDGAGTGRYYLLVECINFSYGNLVVGCLTSASYPERAHTVYYIVCEMNRNYRVSEVS